MILFQQAGVQKVFAEKIVGNRLEPAEELASGIGVLQERAPREIQGGALKRARLGAHRAGQNEDQQAQDCEDDQPRSQRPNPIDSLTPPQPASPPSRLAKSVRDCGRGLAGSPEERGPSAFWD